MHVIVLTSQKGGVGKTTLACLYRRRGQVVGERPPGPIKRRPKIIE